MKKIYKNNFGHIALIIMILFIPHHAFASKMFFTANTGAGGLNNTISIRVLPLMGNTAGNSGTEVDNSSPMPISGELRNLVVSLTGPGFDTGAGTQIVDFSIRVNNATSSVTCSISETEKTCTNLTDTVYVNAGDMVNFSMAPRGTITVGNRVSMMGTFNSTTTDNMSFLLGSCNGGVLDTTNPLYLSHSSTLGRQTTEFGAQTIMPSSGTMKNMYIQLATAPGGATSRTFTMRKNGVDQSVTCTISGANTTCNDTTNSFTFVAGDLLNVKEVPTGAPANSKWGIGVGIILPNKNEFVWAKVGNSAPSTTAVNYSGWGATQAFQTVEASSTSLTYNGIYKNLYVALIGSPDNGAGTQSYKIETRLNGVSIGHSCTISETATTCDDNTAPLKFLFGSAPNVMITPSGTPNSRNLQMSSLVQYTEPSRLFINTRAIIKGLLKIF